MSKHRVTLNDTERRAPSTLETGWLNQGVVRPHSQFIHEDDGNRGCLYTVCDCNRFVVGAEARTPRPGSLPRRIRAPLPGLRQIS